MQGCIGRTETYAAILSVANHGYFFHFAFAEGGAAIRIDTDQGFIDTTRALRIKPAFVDSFPLCRKRRVFAEGWPL